MTEAAHGPLREHVRAFVASAVAPHAHRFEQDRSLPDSLVKDMGRAGWLGGLVPSDYGGGGITYAEFVILHEEVGRGCSSTRSLLTVQAMVTRAVARWGTAAAKAKLLPRLADGSSVGALAISEERVGSDMSAIETTAVPAGEGWTINGRKVWVTFGQRADVLVVLARSPSGHVALAVDRTADGLRANSAAIVISPRDGQLGLQAAEVADITFDDCYVGPEGLLARPGFGISIVATDALTIGRLSVAAGCVGIVQAALEASCARATTRSQFGSPIKDHQLVLRKIADMSVGAESARLLCQRAAAALDAGDSDAWYWTMTAKYAAATAAAEAAGAAVQVCGASGCAPGSVPERLYRDAKVMQIIEGTDELSQLRIGERAVRRNTSAAPQV